MQFRVSKPLKGVDTSFNPAGSHPPLRATPIVYIKPADNRGDKLRQLILVEEEGDLENINGPGSPLADGNPVQSLVNNTKWNGDIEGTTTPVAGSIPNRRGVNATETPQEGATEVWEVANLTPDAHPIHLHLIQFQVISRQPFDVNQYTIDWIAAFPGATINGFTFPPSTYIPGFGPPRPYSVPNSAGAVGGNMSFDTPLYLQQGACAGGACPARAPDPLDSGWKDTIKMFPGEITRIATRWAPQDLARGSTKAGKDYFSFDPTTPPGYIEHCHILDHEDNEFMRTMIVTK
jgi:spore coat protein A, manganese oxidase